MPEKLLYVALDQSDPIMNMELAEQLARSDVVGEFGFKINQDDAFISGPRYIEGIVGLGRPVFVDLKMNNGPRTMTRTIRHLGSLGVAHTNIWAQAESNFAKTMDKLEEDPDRPDVLAITHYTRWDDAYAQKHNHMSLPEFIRHWSEVGVECGADGLIVPGNLLHIVEDLNVTKLNSAVRMDGQVTDSEQVQTSTPYDAIMSGSDIIVVGSPIYKADQPVEALRKHMNEVLRAQEDLAA